MVFPRRAWDQVRMSYNVTLCYLCFLLFTLKFPVPTKPTPTGDREGVTTTSRSLLVRVKDNERQAWDRLVTLYAPLVYHWCQKLDVSPDDAPDVVQEVFKSVAQRIESFRKERSQDTFRGWLRVITRNKAIDHYRRLGKQATAAGGTEAQHRLAAVAAPNFDDDADDPADKHLLFHQALEQIRADFQPKTWQAFWRVVVEDRTPAEAAVELDMTAGAIRVAKCRVLQRLREELGDLLD